MDKNVLCTAVSLLALVSMAAQARAAVAGLWYCNATIGTSIYEGYGDDQPQAYKAAYKKCEWDYRGALCENVLYCHEQSMSSSLNFALKTTPVALATNPGAPDDEARLKADLSGSDKSSTGGAEQKEKKKIE